MKVPPNRPIALPLFIGGALLVSCASAHSEQLAAARSAYDQASRGPASQYAPDELWQAKNLLQEAEAAENGSPEEQHFAYLADRQSRQAAATASIRQNERRLEESRKEYGVLQEQARVAAERGLSETQQKLTESQQAQRAAEERATRAMSSLEELGRVQEEANETTLTISGEVLFKTGEAELLPLAEKRLDAVATALQQLEPSRKVVIEGHTDSLGSEMSNQTLSQERADAVRNYLVQQGVSAAQLTAVGRGESEPIADNATAEGRANNRRVELVIKKTPSD